MKPWAFDLESFLITPGNQAPKLVCMSLYNPEGEQRFVLERSRAVPRFRELLLDPDVQLIGFNAAFDLAVLCRQDYTLMRLVIDAIRAGRIVCGWVRQTLFDIATGEFSFRRKRKGAYSLAGLVNRLFDVLLPKEDTWRLRYGELDGISSDDYPEDAWTYASNDAFWHYNLFAKHQEDLAEDGLTEVPNERAQTEAAFWFYLMQVRGVRTDKAYVETLDREMTTRMDELREKLVEAKIIRWKGKKLSKDTKLIQQLVREDHAARVAAEIKRAREAGVLPLIEDLVLTKTGQVCIDAEELEKTVNPRLGPLREFSKLEHDHSLYMPFLKLGTRAPVNARWNVLVETGRTSCSKPNLQNPPRKGGFRECFIPRPGYLWAFCDYDTLELRTHAQNCLELFGFSKLAEALQAGLDPHTDVGAQLLQISYAEMVARLKAGDPAADEARQLAKVMNFGLAGGMGADAFVAYAAGYGLTITREKAIMLKQVWLAAYPENRLYFKRTGDLTDGGTATQIHLMSGRVRGRCRFTDYNNGLFQGRAADGAKDAVCAVSEECYLEPKSALYGSRPGLFLHDEIGAEIWSPTEEHASAAALRLQKVMEDRMQIWIPNIPSKATVVLTRRWFKGAKPVRRNGLLVPSKPLKVDGKVQWVEDSYAAAA